MSDPYSIQSVGRLGGSLGGRSRVVSSVSPVRRQKFTYPSVPSGWCLHLLHDFTSSTIGPNAAPFAVMGFSDDDYLYMPYSNPKRVNMTTWAVESTPGTTSGLPGVPFFANGFAGASGGVLYGIAHTSDGPRTPQVLSWTHAGGWVHVADLDIGWTVHAITMGRDGKLYTLEQISNAATVRWLSAKNKDFTAGYDWVIAGTNWSTSIVSSRVRATRTALVPATDLTLTYPEVIVAMDGSDSFTFNVEVDPRTIETFTVTATLTRDGSPWGTPASVTSSSLTNTSITATGSSPGSGHTIGAVITVHSPGGALAPADLVDIGVTQVTSGIFETYNGATTHRVHQVTTGGSVSHLSALDYDRSVGAYRSITADSSGVVWISLRQPPAAGPDIGVNTVLRRYDGSVTDVPIQAIVDFANDGNTEAWGAIFCDDEDFVLVPMVRYTTLNQSWFMRVAPDGSTSDLIASTYDTAFATATNIADGPLGTGLANEADQGWGISLDGKTLYFFDNSDQAGHSRGNLLRTLALC